jgi:hypothetical protein
MPAAYHHTDVFRFRHVRLGNVFQVTEAVATDDVPSGFYVRASARKALPCSYCGFSGRAHVDSRDGVRYVPAQLPVIQTQV